MEPAVKADDLLKRILVDDELYCRINLKIRTKEGEIVPFVWNDAQRMLHEAIEKQLAHAGWVRAIVLKGRQQGCSTYVAARFFKRVSTQFGKRCMILAHLDAATQNLFGIVNTFYDLSDSTLRPVAKHNSGSELSFAKLRSGYKVATAGSKNAGRSDTVQYLHGSEAAFWPNAESIMAGLGQTVPLTAGSEVILESTANGMTNLFRQMWALAVAGESDFVPVFIPWFVQREYRRTVPARFELTDNDTRYMEAFGLDMEQMAWRQAKINTDFAGDDDWFNQEYPACIAVGERVSTNRGLIPIEQVVAGDVTPFGTVTQSQKSGTKKVYRLTTKEGYSVLATADHRIKLADSDSFVELQDGVGETIELSTVMLAEEQYTARWPRTPVIESRIEINERVGLFLGLYMGDGSLSHNMLSIVHDAKDTDAIELSSDLIEMLSGDRPARRVTGSKRGCVEVRQSRIDHTEFLLGIGAAEDSEWGARRKVCVPECIFRSPREVVKEFLRGVFEADGFAGYDFPRVVLFSKYEQFLRDIQILLLAFGITSRRASLVKKAGSGKKYVGHELHLRRAEAEKFVEQIGFVSNRKRERAESWAAMPAATTGRKRKKLRMADKVVAIELVGETDVYDLSVPGLERFDASGVVVHNCPDMAFLKVGHKPLINTLAVQAARNANDAHMERIGAHVVGLDPARGGDTSTFIHRQGRVAWGIERMNVRDTMLVAGRAARMLVDDKTIARLFVDVGGIGAGIYDRLVELGYGARVTAVNFGGKATDARRYFNKRCEMWGEMAEWIEDDIPPSIPDDDQLHADLTAVSGDRYSSNGQLKLQSKEDIKKELGRSPDDGDALALTFAEPVAADDRHTEDWRTKLLRSRRRKSAMSA